MRRPKVLFLVLLCTAFLFIPGALLAQGVIINELYNSGGNDEWIELLVVQDSLDMRGWDLRDFSSGGTAQASLEFTTHALWNNLRAGTIIIVARTEVSITEDFDPSDYLLIIKTGNTTYFSGTPFLFAGSSDAIQIRNVSDVHVFGVSWGTGNSGSLPQPKVHFTGTSTSNTSIAFIQGSLAVITDPVSWLMNTTSTLGVGNSPTNTAWINSFRNLADGSGTARVAPDTLSGGTVGPILISYRPNPTYTITDLRVLMPPQFDWSRTSADVSFTGMSATLSVSGDTITMNGVSFSADSTLITIANVTAPDSTGIYRFRVQSRVNNYANVSPVPSMVVFGHPMSIADAKVNDTLGVPLLLNSLITVRGVVTVANEFGGPSYIQDNSAGMAIFGSSFSTAVSIGHEVVVSGIVQPFNGLFEIVSPLLHSIPSTGNTVDPLLVTASQVANDGVGGVELYEGLLVRLNNVSVLGTGTWQANTNYVLNDATGASEIRIDNNTNIVGTPIPSGAFDLIGVVGQFRTTPPYIGGYQIMPRFTEDIISTGPIIATFPVETNIQQTSLTINWSTIYDGSSYVRYGLTPGYELGVVGSATPTTNHVVQLTGLSPATVYYIQAFSVAAGDTSTATRLIASTASPSASTGQINAYFNKSVYTNIAWYQNANGNENLVARLVPRINNAQRSIDAALYSLSGLPGDQIAQVLVNARNRGVRVRVICEYDNSTSNAYNYLRANGVTVIDDRFDPINQGAGLHHNKFFVFDGRGGAPESVWVWTGSWNPTDPGTNNDYQNVVEVQDVALANAFTMEFNEMWGSDTDVPNASQSRFGARKTDNTPHRFNIAGRLVECYFSPSDRTTSKMLAAFAAAGQSIAFNIYTFTRSDLATMLVARKNAGKKVRGVMDNNTDTGTQYPYLVANNIDVRLKTGSGLLHHKTALVDAENPHWNSLTITGSHNWSNSAENSNNENTVFIYDGNITNQYLQEFAARYYQFGGSDTIYVSVRSTGNEIPAAYALSQNYPNPFNPTTTISYQLSTANFVRLKVYDVLGREVATLVNGPQQAGHYDVEFTGDGLASGVYFYRLEAGNFVDQKKMLMLK